MSGLKPGPISETRATTQAVENLQVTSVISRLLIVGIVFGVVHPTEGVQVEV
jgi:hypothetical protein